MENEKGKIDLPARISEEEVGESSGIQREGNELGDLRDGSSEDNWDDSMTRTQSTTYHGNYRSPWVDDVLDELVELDDLEDELRDYERLGGRDGQRNGSPDNTAYTNLSRELRRRMQEEEEEDRPLRERYGDGDDEEFEDWVREVTESLEQDRENETTNVASNGDRDPPGPRRNGERKNVPLRKIKESLGRARDNGASNGAGDGIGHPPGFWGSGVNKYVPLGDSAWARKMRGRNVGLKVWARERATGGRNEMDWIAEGQGVGQLDGEGSDVGNIEGSGDDGLRTYKIFGERIKFWKELSRARNDGNESESPSRENLPTSESKAAYSHSPITPKLPFPKKQRGLGSQEATFSFLHSAEDLIKSFVNGTHKPPNPTSISTTDIETSLACINLALVQNRHQLANVTTEDPPQPDIQEQLEKDFKNLQSQHDQYLTVSKLRPDFTPPPASQHCSDLEKQFAELKRRFLEGEAQNYILQGPDTYLADEEMGNLMIGIYEGIFGVCRTFLVLPDFSKNGNVKQMQGDKRRVLYVIQHGLRNFYFMAAKKLWGVVMRYLAKSFLPGLDVGDEDGFGELLLELDRWILKRVNHANPPSHSRWKADTARLLAVHVLQLGPDLTADLSYAAANPTNTSLFLTQRNRLRETVDDAVLSSILPKFQRMIVGLKPGHDEVLLACLREIMTYAFLLYTNLQTSRTELRFVMPERGMVFDPEAMDVVNPQDKHLGFRGGSREVLEGISGALMRYDSQGRYSCVVKAKVILRGFGDFGDVVEDPENEGDDSSSNSSGSFLSEEDDDNAYGGSRRDLSGNQGQGSGYHGGAGYQGERSSRGRYQGQRGRGRGRGNGNQDSGGYQSNSSDRGRFERHTTGRGGHREGNEGERGEREERNPRHVEFATSRDNDQGSRGDRRVHSDRGVLNNMTRGRGRGNTRGNARTGGSEDTGRGRGRGQGNTRGNGRTGDSSNTGRGRGRGERADSRNTPGNSNETTSERGRDGGRGRGRGSDRGPRGGGQGDSNGRGRGGGGRGGDSSGSATPVRKPPVTEYVATGGVE